jgi:nicotinamide-nucleotide amidase
MAQELDEVGKRLGDALEGAGRRVGVAESLTGGELAARLACVPGSGEWFRGGIVAYASGVKHDLLEVPRGSVVSAAAAAAMAESAARLLGTDLTVAVTGVAGPDDQEGSPPGTVWFAQCDRGRTETRLETFSGEPADVVDATCVTAMTWLREAVVDDEQAAAG